MRTILIIPIALISAMMLARAAAAEPESFPYEALVTVEDAAVHSGPGEEFYATSKLEQGSRVEVYRHDPDGWRMIRPPETAFSLIPAESIEPLDNNTARIVTNHVCARVGSSLSDDFNVEQIPLRIGTRVELLSEQHAPDDWVAIRPPRGEYRWIRAEYLKRADPTPVSSAAGETESAMAADSGDSPAESDESHNLFDSLAELDRQLEGLDEENPAVWPLEALSVGYLRLKRSHLDSAREIDTRLARIAELKSIRDEYLGIAEAPGEPKSSVAMMKGGAELAASPEVAAIADPVHKAYRRPTEMADYYPTNINTLPRDDGTTATPAPMADHDGPSIPTPGNLSAKKPVAESPPVSLEALTAATPPQSTGEAAAAQSSAENQSQPLAQPQAMPSNTEAAPRRFDAVGYLQQAVDPSPGAPSYILVSREGEIMAYLQLPANAPIEPYIGFPMGVDGKPRRLPNLKLPLITVERLTPVRF